MPDKTTIFDSRLDEDEYIIWHGEVDAGINFFHPVRYAALLNNLVNLVLWFVKKYIYFILIPSILVVSMAVIFAIINLDISYDDAPFLQLGSSIICMMIALIFGILTNLIKISPADLTDHSKIRLRLISAFTKNQYAITNQRVLLYEDGHLSETSLILMQDAVKTKPKSGKSDINLYNQRSPTGQLPAPIATLNNLSEDDAEAAYDLLIHARDISFEERIEDLGLD